MRTPALAASLAALTAASALHAQTRVVYVDQTRPFNGNGSTWEQAFRNIADAVANASVNTQQTSVEIRVAQGTHRPALDAPDDFTFISHRQTTSAFSLSILGGFGGLRSPNPDARDLIATPTIISGDRNGDDTSDGTHRDDNVSTLLFANRMASFDPRYSTWLTLDGLVFEGSAPDLAGTPAVYVIESFWYHPVEINDCVFRDNHGTGLCIAGPRAYIRRSRFERNRGHAGGGLYLVGPGWADVDDCQFIDNSAYRGGALYSSTSTYVTRCVIAGNRAAQEGGGVWGDASVFNSLIIANRAETMGGGLYGRSLLIQSTVADNAARWGGGVHTFGSWWTHSIIARNSATIAGPQVSMAEGTLNLDHCILQGGREDVFFAFNANLTSDGLRDQDPRFRDPNGPDGDPRTWRDNDYQLAPNSPAINAGRAERYSDEFRAADVAGHPRPMPRLPNALVRDDLGCYEYQPRCPADTNQDDGVTTDDLLDFLTAFTLGQPLADIDDGSQTNTPDDGVTIEDLLYFLSRYNAGC